MPAAISHGVGPLAKTALCITASGFECASVSLGCGCPPPSVPSSSPGACTFGAKGMVGKFRCSASVAGAPIVCHPSVKTAHISELGETTSGLAETFGSPGSSVGGWALEVWPRSACRKAVPKDPSPPPLCVCTNAKALHAHRRRLASERIACWRRSEAVFRRRGQRGPPASSCDAAAVPDMAGRARPLGGAVAPNPSR